jgi:alkylation response protein AidB-like acyl-CoA dehydrogenase
VPFAETNAQLALQEAARDAVENVVAPIAACVPAGEKLAPEHLRTIYAELVPLGYLGSTVPKDLGGAGLSYVDYGLLLEALAAGPVALGEIVVPRTINDLGSDEQKREWLPRLFSGDWISTAAIMELDTKGVRHGDAYVVNGRTRRITLGGVSDLITLMVADGDGGLSHLILEHTVSPWKSSEVEAVGARSLSFADLEFNDVRVPQANLLGTAGAGAEELERGIEASRAFAGMQAVGLARHALDIAMTYETDRAAALVDADAHLQAARLRCLSTLAVLDSGRRVPSHDSTAVEIAIHTCQVAMASMGARGLTVDADVERCRRDCVMLMATVGDERKEDSRT